MLSSFTQPAWQAQKGEGREKSAKVGKRKGSSFPNPPPFSIPPYPLPLSTPATQAKLYINGRSMIPPVFFFAALAEV